MTAPADQTAEAALPAEADLFEAVRQYIHRYGLVRHQIESFNHFLEVLLPLIVQENSDVTATAVADGRKRSYHVQWTNVVVMPPTVKESSGFERALTPDAARQRSLTYSSSVVCDLVHDCFDVTDADARPTHVWRKCYKEVVIARIPIMLGSSACYLHSPAARGRECPLDALGYFLVNGSEKTLLAQVRGQA